MTYKIFVDDNFHFMDEDERYCAGEFETAAEALAKCRQIVEADIENCAKPGMTAAEIYDAYTSFGDDPFIKGVEFSAWTYAKTIAERKARQDTIDTLLKPKG
jgi:hypothetical protein